MKLSILLIGSVSIAIVSAQDIAFGTNKTLAPTFGVTRPPEPTSPAPITPFPTEEPVVSIICCCSCAFVLHRILASLSLFD